MLLGSYLGATASWATGLDKIKHAHACIPVHVFVTCAKEDPEQHKTGKDEIEFRRLNIEVSAHLAPFVVFVNEGQDPTEATQHSGNVSHTLVHWVLQKLNPIMPLPNLPRKTERRPWRMLYETGTLDTLDKDATGLEKADNTFGLKAVKKKEGNPGIFCRFLEWEVSAPYPTQTHTKPTVPLFSTLRTNATTRPPRLSVCPARAPKRFRRLVAASLVAAVTAVDHGLRAVVVAAKRAQRPVASRRAPRTRPRSRQSPWLRARCRQRRPGGNTVTLPCTTCAPAPMLPTNSDPLRRMKVCTTECFSSTWYDWPSQKLTILLGTPSPCSSSAVAKVGSLGLSSLTLYTFSDRCEPLSVSLSHEPPTLPAVASVTLLLRDQWRAKSSGDWNCRLPLCMSQSRRSHS